MGVSGLLKSVLKKYPSVHLPAPNPNIKVSFLFLDFNAFIYKTIAEFPNTGTYNFTKDSDVEKYEDILIQKVIENTINLTKTVNPDKLLYIAIDGPPPMAKMVQQRERRYKNPFMESLLKQIEPNKVKEGVKYDTNRITPGTRLMSKLDNEFEKAINEGKFGKIAVVLDGSNIAGEAEHKFLKLIEEIKSKETFVIFSGDGDVILLALRFPNKNVYIMQGVANTALDEVYPETQEFAYLDVKTLANSIYDLYNEQSGGKTQLSNKEKNLANKLKNNGEIANNFLSKDKKDFLIDFIFLTFLEGNDFVKPIYFMKYKEDHLRTPLGIYRFQRKFQDSRLIYQDTQNQFQINQPFLLSIFKRLGNIEMDKIQEIKNRIEKKISNPPQKRNNKPESIEHKLYTNQDHALHKEYLEQFNYLFGDIMKFKERYYSYFWGTEYNVNEIVKSYLDILLFNIRYYFGTGLYWRINYHSIAAPMPSDVSTFLQQNPDYYKNLVLHDSKPVHPFVLLAFVMPPQTLARKGIIPASYRTKLIKEYPEYFPEKVEIKLLEAGGKLIYSEPYLINPPLEILEEVLDKVKLTKDEKLRNELKTEPYIYMGKNKN